MELFIQKKKQSFAQTSDQLGSMNLIHNSSNNMNHRNSVNLLVSPLPSANGPYFARSSLKTNSSQFKMIKEKLDFSKQELIKTRDKDCTPKQRKKLKQKDVSISIIEGEDLKDQCNQEVRQGGGGTDIISFNNSINIHRPSLDRNLHLDTEKSPNSKKNSEVFHFWNEARQQNENTMLIIPGQQEIISQSQVNKRDSLQFFKSVLTRIYIQRSMKRIINKLYSRRKSNLQKNHLDLISDQSAVTANNSKGSIRYPKMWNLFLKLYEQTSLQSFFDSEIKQINEQNKIKIVKVFNPANRILLIWGVLISIITITMVCTIPLVISFQIPIDQIINNNLVKVMQGLQVVDMVVQSNTAIYNKGIIIEDRLTIFKFYFKQNFWVDLIGILSIFLLESIESISFYHAIFLVYLVKLNYFTQFFKRLEENFHFKPETSQLFSLLKLLLQIIIISHFFSCIWIFVYTTQKSLNYQDSTWLDCKDKAHSKWYIQYLYAYYYSTVTMVTVGYGDITPQSNIEVIVCIFTILVSCGVFGYSLNQLGSIFEHLQKRGKEIRKSMCIINTYMYNKGIPDQLQYQVREYLDYIWHDISADTQQQEQIIIQSLSESLQNALLYEASKMIVQDFAFFTNNFSQEFLLKLTSIVSENKFSPGEIIVAKDYMDDSSLYFIESGRVELCLYDFHSYCVKQTLQVFEKNSHFGLYSFITGQKQDFSIRTIDFTSVLQIKRQDFINLIQMYQEDFERFSEIKDEVFTERNLNPLQSKCFSCGLNDHYLDKCPYIHFIPNASKLKALECKVELQERKKSQRKTAFLCVDFHRFNIDGQAIKFIQQNEKEIEEYIDEYIRIEDHVRCKIIASFFLFPFYQYKLIKDLDLVESDSQNSGSDQFTQITEEEDDDIESSKEMKRSTIRFAKKSTKSKNQLKKEEVETQEQLQPFSTNVNQDKNMYRASTFDDENMKLSKSKYVLQPSLRKTQKFPSCGSLLMSKSSLITGIQKQQSLKDYLQQTESRIEIPEETNDRNFHLLQKVQKNQLNIDKNISIQEKNKLIIISDNQSEEELSQQDNCKEQQNIHNRIPSLEIQQNVNDNDELQAQNEMKQLTLNFLQKQQQEQEKEQKKQQQLNLEQQIQIPLEFIQQLQKRAPSQHSLDTTNSANKIGGTSIEYNLMNNYVFRQNLEKSPPLRSKNHKDTFKNNNKYQNNLDTELEGLHLSPKSHFSKGSNRVLTLKVDSNEIQFDNTIKKVKQQNILSLLSGLEKNKKKDQQQPLLQTNTQTKNTYLNSLLQRRGSRQKTKIMSGQSKVLDNSESLQYQLPSKSTLKIKNPSSQVIQNQEQAFLQNSTTHQQRSITDNQYQKVFYGGSNPTLLTSNQKIQLSANILPSANEVFLLQQAPYENYYPRLSQLNQQRIDEIEFQTNFEAQKNFRNYFVKFNMLSVISRYIKYAEKTRKKIKIQSQKQKKASKLNKISSLSRKDTKIF